MFTFNPRLMAGAALAAALLAGCGGNSDDHGGNGTAGQAAQTITDVAAYINSLIVGSSDNTEPVDISALTLVTDDTAEAAPLQ